MALNIVFLSFLMSLLFTSVPTSPKESLTPEAAVSKVFYEPTYSVEVKRDITYGYGLSHDSFAFENPREMALKLDIYSPKNNLSNRPVVVLIHGGGFRSGTKDWSQFIDLSNFFASRGWVVFNIDYRLMRHFGSLPKSWAAMIDLRSSSNSKKNKAKASYPAIRDSKAAIRWIVANKNELGINPDYITVGGGSAGAVAAIAVGISDNVDFKDELSVQADPTLLTTNLNQTYKVKTVLDFWGSKGGVDAISRLYNKEFYNENNPALFIAHGTDDPTVSYQKAKDLEAVYKTTGAPYILYPLKGQGHGPWRYKQNGKSLGDLALKFISKQQQLEVL